MSRHIARTCPVSSHTCSTAPRGAVVLNERWRLPSEPPVTRPVPTQWVALDVCSRYRGPSRPVRRVLQGPTLNGVIPLCQGGSERSAGHFAPGCSRAAQRRECVRQRALAEWTCRRTRVAPSRDSHSSESRPQQGSHRKRPARKRVRPEPLESILSRSELPESSLSRPEPNLNRVPYVRGVLQSTTLNGVISRQ